ncbi:MAG: hypothetical protein ACRYGC_15420 [Janthinobacterium lividum]
MDTQAASKARSVGTTRQGAPGATVPSAQRGGRALGAVLAAVVALGGCGSRRVALDAPVQWWHDLEGGTIAQQRPPPPGVGQPYPRIGTVPARPVLPDAAARIGETDRLAAQREQAERALTRTPLPAPGTATAQALASEGVVPAVAAPAGAPPAGGTAAVPASAPAATPGATAAAGTAPAGAAAPAAADPNLASATLDAAVAAPAAPAARARAAPPAAPSQRATPQELAALQDSAPAAGAPLVAAGQTADAGVMLPPVAAEPPPAPSFEVAVAGAPPSGVAVDAPPPAAREPLSRATPLEPLSRRGTPVRFQPGSALLLPDQAGVLRALAERRGRAPVSVTGYGDAGADTPDAQSDALSLGLQRAQAMSAVLGTYGVPAGDIRIAAEAFGRGGTVRLLH